MFNQNPNVRASMAANASASMMGGNQDNQSQYFTHNNSIQGAPMQPGPQAYDSLGPIKREPVKLKLSDRERGFYSNLYSQVNPESKKEVESKDVVQFLFGSGLEQT